MNRRAVFLFGVFLSVIPNAVALAKNTEVQRKAAAASTLDRIPLAFEENRGQAPAEVKFLSRAPGYLLFLDPRGAQMAFRQGSRHATVRMELLQANRQLDITGVAQQRGITNYQDPNNAARSVTGIPNYGQVRYDSVYRGIDMLYHGERRRLEYDFIVAPGANPKRIGLRFDGAERVALDPNGELVISTSAGELRQQKPIAYQEIDGSRKLVEVSYAQDANNTFGFRIGAYDSSKPLVIDPILTFSTFLGGTGAETATGVAVDSSGDVYVTGSTNSADFPIQHDPGQCHPYDDPEIQPCISPFVIKIDPNGPTVLYATYFRVGDNGASAIAVDSQGNAYLTGGTDTGFDPAVGSHVFMAKLNSSGSQLLYYKLIDLPISIIKNPNQSFGSAIAVDGTGNAYATGSFAHDVFVIKLDPNGNTVWSYVPENTAASDQGTALAVDAAGSVYVTGYASSAFPTTQGAFQPTCSSNGSCMFVLKLDSQGSIVYSTFFDAAIAGVAANNSGNAYVTGGGQSGSIPTVNAMKPSPNCGTCAAAFVAEFNTAGSGLVFSTYLSDNSSFASAITLDASQNIYVAGQGFPAVNSIAPPPSSNSGAYVAELNPSASGFIYSTYFGNGFPNAIAADGRGNAFVAGNTGAANFPTVRAIQPTIGGFATTPSCCSSDGFLSEISPSLAAVPHLVQANSIEGSGTSSVSTSFSANNSAGNLIIAAVRMSTTYETVTVTDSAGNFYADAVSQVQTADGHQIHIFYAANIRGGANTVHASFSSTNNHPWLAIFEYSGIATTNPLDQVAHAQGNDASPFTGLITTTNANELEFAITGMPATYGGIVSAGPGYAMQTQDTGSSRAAAEAATLSSTGQYAGRFNLSSSTNWTAAVATFQVASIVIPPPSITRSFLFNAIQNQQYSDTVTGTNGKFPYQWSVASGSLPAGLTLNPNDGTISGTATSTGTFSFTVQLTDANSQTATQTLTINVNPNAPPPTITSSSLPPATQGQPYSTQLMASGGVAPYTWQLQTVQQCGCPSPATPPNGLTLSAGGILSGTPTQTGNFGFTVYVTDADYHSSQQFVTITVSSGTTSGGTTAVQSNMVAGTGVASVSTSFSSPNTAGNTIIAFIRMSSASQTVRVTDSAGNTYTDAVAQVQTADGHQTHLFYASNIKGGTNTVTATFSGTNNHPWLAIYEYPGALHVDATAAAQGSGTAVSTGATATTSSASELIFAGIGLPASSTASISAGSGFTMLQQNASGSPGANESQAASATGSFTGTFTLSAPENWTALIATFTSGSPAPPPPPPPSGPISRVQSNAAEATGVTSIAIPFLGANTAGNMIIAFVRMSTTSQTVSVTDAAGNTYTDAVSQTQDADGSQIHIFYAPNIKAGSNTVTARFSGANNHPFLAVYEYSGVTTLDSTAHAQGSNASPNSGTTAAASASNELVFGGMGLPASSGVSVSAGSGWTLELQDSKQNGSRSATEDAITNLPGPFDATFALSGSANWSSIVASFKP
ncbi:MAG TPA: SBBP repeat-containing protein [Terriglobia bacterium]|nr:SBBP repeat-containing protein [Terriglobia bacterium]